MSTITTWWEQVRNPFERLVKRFRAFIHTYLAGHVDEPLRLGGIVGGGGNLGLGCRHTANLAQQAMG